MMKSSNSNGDDNGNIMDTSVRDFSQALARGIDEVGSASVDPMAGVWGDAIRIMTEANANYRRLMMEEIDCEDGDDGSWSYDLPDISLRDGICDQSDTEQSIEDVRRKINSLGWTNPVVSPANQYVGSSPSAPTTTVHIHPQPTPTNASTSASQFYKLMSVEINIDGCLYTIISGLEAGKISVYEGPRSIKRLVLMDVCRDDYMEWAFTAIEVLGLTEQEQKERMEFMERVFDFVSLGGARICGQDDDYEEGNAV